MESYRDTMCVYIIKKTKKTKTNNKLYRNKNVNIHHIPYHSDNNITNLLSIFLDIFKFILKYMCAY